MNTLDQWEKEANEDISGLIETDTYCIDLNKRLCALIELVRKKDFFIRDIQKHFNGEHKEFCETISHPYRNNCDCGKNFTDRTLALTDELK